MQSFQRLIQEAPLAVGLCVSPGRFSGQQSAPAVEGTAPQPGFDTGTDLVRPSSEAALAVLLCPTPELQKLTVSWASETTIHLMSPFSSLTFCDIMQPEDVLDVTPLSSLANLQELSLAYGAFNDVHPPEPLTCLRIFQATATICAHYHGHSSLLELHIGDCELNMPGSAGLRTYTQLQVLECGKHTVMTAPNAINSLSLVAPIHVPADFFSLSGLTKLSMVFLSSQAVYVGGNIDTAWLCGLSNLQNLALHVYHDGDHCAGLCMTVDDNLTRLKNLQYLLAAADTGCAIHFCVPWHLMTALHSIDFQVSVGITGDISDLLQASRLKTITYTSTIEEEDSEIVTYAPEAFVWPWKEREQYIQLHHPTFECQFAFHY